MEKNMNIHKGRLGRRKSTGHWIRNDSLILVPVSLKEQRTQKYKYTIWNQTWGTDLNMHDNQELQQGGDSLWIVTSDLVYPIERS